MQNDNGSWPDEYDFSLSKSSGAWTSHRGVRVGGSYNDGATTNSAIQMFIAYALTGDAKYLSKLGGLGQWIFDTQMGEGDVRGWCQQYDFYNKAMHARHFELPVIEPRTYNRFIVPHATWYYALTGDERYYTILREGYEWLRSVETPEGWAYQYLPDGTPVVSWQYRLLRFDQPESWPPDSLMGGHAEWRKFNRNKVNLEGAEQVLAVLATGGLDSLCTLIRGPMDITTTITNWHLAAAQRATDPETEAKVRQSWNPGQNFKIATINAWIYLQYLFDVSVARGEITATKLADRLCGFHRNITTEQPPGYDWTRGLVHYDDWLAVPIPNLR
jgi:hypothetical protein